MTGLLTEKRDRRASLTEVRAAQNHVLSPRGCGLEVGAAHVGISQGQLSKLLSGKTKDRPMLSILRKLRELPGRQEQLG